MVADTLDTNLSELKADWRYEHLVLNRNTATQVLGIAAFELGTIQAIKAPSARDPNFDNIIVFPGRLVPGEPSYIEVYDDLSLIKFRLP
jgi:hypothetical protein